MALPALSPDLQVRIVVGYTLDARGDEALREAIRIGNYGSASEIVAVHALSASGSDRAAIEAETRAAAWQRIRPILEEEPARVSIDVRFASPLVALSAAAAEHQADLIILGTWRGRVGLRPRPGSLAQRLEANGDTPVLTAQSRPVAETLAELAAGVRRGTIARAR